jgi:hypothetical protein
MTRARAGRLIAAATVGFALPAAWISSAAAPSGGQLGVFLAAAVVLGGPLAIATAFLLERAAMRRRGRDLAEQVLAVTTSGLRDGPHEWGAAMRAELACIDDPGERRRFATGCAVTALRIGAGRMTWWVAIGTGVLFATGTYAASRTSLAGGEGGIMGYTLLAPIPVLFATGFIAARAARSFRTGLVTGSVALLVGLIGMLGMAVIEAAHWYDVAGVYLMDGDAPGRGGDRLGAVLDPVSPSYVLLHLQLWGAWPVLGAALGSRRGRPAGEAAYPGRRASQIESSPPA